MSDSIHYVLAAISSMLSLLLGYNITSQNNRITKLEDNKVGQDHCSLQQENISLKVNAHVTKELTDLKDEVLDRLAKLESHLPKRREEKEEGK